jgi:hypothetical protein
MKNTQNAVNMLLRTDVMKRAFRCSKFRGTQNITWRISPQSDKKGERWRYAFQYSVTVGETIFTKLEHVPQLCVKNAYTELYENPTKITVHRVVTGSHKDNCMIY